MDVIPYEQVPPVVEVAGFIVTSGINIEAIRGNVVLMDI